MNKIDDLLPDSIKEVSVSRQPEVLNVHEENPQYNSEPGHDLVDAINQMFAEFELAYHNQFHKAYSAEGSVGLAKKYWLSSLKRFSPQVILKTARQVATTQQYLPSLSNVVEACENAMTLFGLPSSHEAYREACCASEPKLNYSWSHPAVYFAGKACGWFALANQMESQIYPLFDFHYKKMCERALNGMALELPVGQALTEDVVEELNAEQQKSRLQKLRAELKL